MEIHLISSLTPDDESRLAPQMLAAIGGVLEALPVSYSVRIETAIGNGIAHSHTAQREPAPVTEKAPPHPEPPARRRATD